MIRLKPSLGHILGINVQLMMGFAFCLVAWAVWPTSLKWWGFGAASLILGLVGPYLIIQAAITMFKLRSREATVRSFMAQARPPGGARLADRKALKRAGMLDD